MSLSTANGMADSGDQRATAGAIVTATGDAVEAMLAVDLSLLLPRA